MSTDRELPRVAGECCFQVPEHSVREVVRTYGLWRHSFELGWNQQLRGGKQYQYKDSTNREDFRGRGHQGTLLVSDEIRVRKLVRKKVIENTLVLGFVS